MQDSPRDRSHHENSPHDDNEPTHTLTLDSKPSMASPRTLKKQWIQTQNIEDFIFCMKARYWTLMLVLLELLVFVIILAILSTPHWVKQRDDYRQWEGGLLICTDCPDKYDGDSYATLADDDDICDNSNLDGLCTTFKNLRDAGAVFTAFSVIALFTMTVWFVRTAMLFCGRRFKLWFSIAWPIMTLFFFILGFIVWAGVSKAKFQDVDNCDKLSTEDREDLCATDGPGLALFNIFLLGGVAVLDVVVSTSMALKS